MKILSTLLLAIAMILVVGIGYTDTYVTDRDVEVCFEQSYNHTMSDSQADQIKFRDLLTLTPMQLPKGYFSHPPVPQLTIGYLLTTVDKYPRGPPSNPIKSVDTTFRKV